jgi:alkanesulfonate monooxygenase SsuD/methylene tetrahydromethanopterin reductase-like flavin-dependent oxidoreductase (luciferase family)
MSTSRRIEFGVYLPQLQMDFEAIRRRVELADRLGFDTVWFYDHLYPPHLPDVPGFEGWTLVSALAVLTERIRLGQLVLCNAFRHPALLAKMAATLDVISRGRLELGLGTGSYLDEFAEFGLPCPDIATRTEELDEACAVLKLLLTSKRSSFEGRHYRLNEAPSALFPVQKPYPRIVIGGGGERRTLPLVARHADVWNCPTYSLSQLEHKVHAMRRACEEIDRDPESLVYGQQAVVVLVDRPADLPDELEIARRRFGGEAWGLEAGGLIGTPAQIIDQIRGRIELGITQFALFFHDRGEPESLERFAREILPAFRADAG